ncbi:NADH-quinone oxidoreductase subunit NuoH [candidate division FCPU426 bacterium]|nr:NADH-quinone oxidoreductase subunit NuoH [candidate division FCPU426 bacterium]
MTYIAEPAQLVLWLRGGLQQLAVWAGLPAVWGDWLGTVMEIFSLFAFCAVLVMVLVYAERKIAGHMQDRLGPMRVGWHGVLQVVADTIKLIFKESEVPAQADRCVYRAAPYVVFLAGFLALLALPLDKGVLPVHLNVGVIYILAAGTPGVVGILMAGWGSGNKYSLLGGLRSAAQMISYEVPLVLSLLGIVMLGRSLDLQQLVAAQTVPFVLYQPVAFIVFLIAAVAETNRNPFDIPEAESELTAGFHTEYGGIRFAYFFLAEYVKMFVFSALAATLFLGGWRGPVLPGWCWFFIKTGGMLFLFFWFRWTFPRLRADQLMNLGWKILTPLAFLNIIGTALMLMWL